MLDESPPTWDRIRADVWKFCKESSALGYNAVTLDDVAHLYHHPLHEEELRLRIAFLRDQFRQIFRIVIESKMQVFLTVDAVPMTAALERHFCYDREAIDRYFQNMIASVLDDFPEIAGIILRIGESDARDVKDPLKSHLHIKSAAHANEVLHLLLPEFVARERTLIFRTWTVGAYGIGDLIWHRDTISRALAGLGGEHFIVSMKHGESDFFRYLPLNKAFFHVPQKKIIELQARREYEGAGEYPSFILKDCLAFHTQLATIKNMVGMSVWCQTGGWHRFKRLAFLQQDESDRWIRANVLAAIRIFRYGDSRDEFLQHWMPQHAKEAGQFIDSCDHLIEQGLYIKSYARQKNFFRRLRLPPLLHTYWDSVYVHPFLRVFKQQLICDYESELAADSQLMSEFAKLKANCQAWGWPADDIEHMEDLWRILLLVRAYYFSPDSDKALSMVRDAKKAYKKRWPAAQRTRYRIKTNFPRQALSPKLVKWCSKIFLRGKRGYRIFDQIVTIHGLAILFKATSANSRKALPKALRKLAMGIDTLFR